MLSDSESVHLPSRSKGIDDVLRALKNNDPKAEVLKPYLSAGRWISPAINPYANLTSVFFTAMQESEVGNEEELENQSSEIDQKEELKIFGEIMKLVPSFKEVVIACSGHRRALLNLIRMLQDASHSARNDDVAKTNACIVEYIRPDSSIEYDRDEFPLPSKSDYSERGWNHPEYAVLLYPMASHDNLNSHELAQILYDVEHGEQSISESEWPAFLYPRGTNPDVEDDLAGLFRGYLLPMVFRQIFTSPGSALKPNTTKKGRACKAQLHNVTSITGRHIAYVCVMTRIALRGLGWTVDDGSFEYQVFYQNIVSLFEGPYVNWAKETIAWWTEQIPGLPRSTASNAKRGKKNITGIEGRIVDPIERAAAQLAARKASTLEPVLSITSDSESHAAAATKVSDSHPVLSITPSDPEPEYHTTPVAAAATLADESDSLSSLESDTPEEHISIQKSAPSQKRKRKQPHALAKNSKKIKNTRR